MLDVHAPHQPTHTWKNFFIHIATIVIGLIIAVGLEQSVEALHRRHERTELRASLRRELEQLDYDASHEDEDAAVHTAWLSQIEAAIETCARTEQRLELYRRHRPEKRMTAKIRTTVPQKPVDA